MAILDYNQSVRQKEQIVNMAQVLKERGLSTRVGRGEELGVFCAGL